jgi:hypothetical protein
MHLPSCPDLVGLIEGLVVVAWQLDPVGVSQANPHEVALQIIGQVIPLGTITLGADGRLETWQLEEEWL